MNADWNTNQDSRSTGILSTGKLVIIASAVFLICFAAGLLLKLYLPDGTIKVPKIKGLTYGEASEKVESAGLVIKVDPDLQTPAEGGLEDMEVDSQDPKAGTAVEKDSVVTASIKGLAEKKTDEKSTSTSQTPKVSHSVCIDPGHSVNSPSSELDPGGTGLDVADNSGASGELQPVWDLAQKVKARLESKGYTVKLTKPSVDSYSSLRTRADIGNTCDIMVRLHYDPALQAVVVPGEGQYKQNGSSIVYVDPNVARASAELANAMLPALQTVGIPKIVNDTGGSSNNQGSAYVGSVLSRVPVVLIENSPSMISGNPAGQDKTADAIVYGIETYFNNKG